ncbi:MAG: guanylate kinase [Elusimicrobia bacterium]|nr:guanylate kinase [Elusimicrobiota bacterium]
MPSHNSAKSPGFPLVISAPSGTGKSTVCRKLLERNKFLRCSISCTTRPPRFAERNGRDYFFLDSEEFKRKIHRHDFLEWAIVHEAYYGTPRQPLEAHIASGHIVMLAIDVQGAMSIRRKRPDTVTVFLMPPSWDCLEERLRRRRQDPHDAVDRRLAQAPVEMNHAKSFDYVVVNDSLDKAVQQLESIIGAEKLRTGRQNLSAYHVDNAVIRRK